MVGHLAESTAGHLVKHLAGTKAAWRAVSWADKLVHSTVAQLAGLKAACWEQKSAEQSAGSRVVWRAATRAALTAVRWAGSWEQKRADR